MHPPRLACWILRICVPATERECVEGDFFEEFVLLHAQAPRSVAATWWSLGYVVRSIVPFVQMRLRRIPAVRLVATNVGALLFGAACFTAARSLRIFVLVHVPLRAADRPTLGYVALETLVVLAVAGLGGFIAHQLHAEFTSGRPS